MSTDPTVPQTTERWVPIPHKPGDPQPRIADGIYQGIRSDGRGGFEGLLPVPQTTPKREARGEPSGWGGTCGWCGADTLAMSCWRCGLWSGETYELVEDKSATTIWAPPDWSTGTPPEPGIYIGWARSRVAKRPDLYEWTGTGWQHHHHGWFDHAITHWIRLNG